MRLRPRIWLAIGGASLALTAALLLLLPHLVLTGFERIERQDMRTNVERATSSLQERCADLAAKSADWADWDDTHRFLVDHDPAFVESNLGDNVFGDIRVNLVAFVDLKGDVVYARDRDFERDLDRPVDPELVARLDERGALARTPDARPEHAGILMLPGGPLLISSRPTLTSDGEGPTTGTLVFGRWLDAGAIADIGRRTRLDLHMHRLDRGRLVGDQAEELGLLTHGDSIGVRARGAARLAGWRVIPDAWGRPALLLEVSSARPIVHEGARSVRLIVMWVLIATVLMGGLSVWMVERGVLRPVMRLSDEVAGIGSHHDFTRRVSVAGQDELAMLARDVNSMLDAIGSSQASLHESESVLRTFYDHGDIQRGVVEVEDGLVRYIHCNANSAAMIGRAPDDIRGRTAAELGLAGELNRAWTEAYAASEASGRPHPFEYEIQMRGERRFMAGIVSILDRPAGAPARFGYVVEDVTARRQVEAELRDARDAAEAASRAKSQFLATMSHEIRTPLNGVLGMTTLLLDSPLDTLQREHAQLIQSSAEVLLDVLNDILDLSKIEAERMTLEPLPFDLRELLEDLAELMQGRAQEKQVEIIVHVTAEAPRFVVGDAKRVRQVLLNLVGNAIKFTSSGCVVLQADGHPTPDGQSRFRLSVTDTGVGIPIEHQDRLFQPFSQADASTSRRFGGTGLGLAISKRLVELMGGTIGFTSDEGLGSVFWIEIAFPLAPAVPSGWPQPRSGLTALVLDDLGPARGAIVDTLASAGIRAHAVGNGIEAIDAFHDPGLGPFDLVITDAPHAGADGGAFDEARQAEPALADIPRIMIALGGGAEGAAHAADLGCAAYLTKPLRAHLLLAAIEAVTRDAGWRSRGLVKRESLVEAHRATLAIPVATRFEGARILVAEDNLTNQKVVVRMLERYGCHVSLASDGSEAVQLASAGGFDLVLMDVQMPGMDGLEAARAIRALSGDAKDVTIVALTANSMAHERQATIDAGMDGFVSKPLRRDDLEQALRTHLPPDLRKAA